MDHISTEKTTFIQNCNRAPLSTFFLNLITNYFFFIAPCMIITIIIIIIVIIIIIIIFIQLTMGEGQGRAEAAT